MGSEMCIRDSQRQSAERNIHWSTGGKRSESLEVDVDTPQRSVEGTRRSSSLRRGTMDDEAATLQKSASGYITASEEVTDSDSESRRARHSEYTTPKSVLKRSVSKESRRNTQSSARGRTTKRDKSVYYDTIENHDPEGSEHSPTRLVRRKRTAMPEKRRRSDSDDESSDNERGRWRKKPGKGHKRAREMRRKIPIFIR